MFSVQLIRNPQYEDSNIVDFRGIALQVIAGSPRMPVGKFEWDTTVPENRQLQIRRNWTFENSFRFLTCPNDMANSVLNNTVTHTLNSDKSLEFDPIASGNNPENYGPVFTWRPTPEDGIWDPNTGYGAIHAK